MEGRPICKFFQQGNCTKGASCRFAHEMDQSKMSDQPIPIQGNFGSNEPLICKYFLEGNCKNPKCHSIHAYSKNLDHIALDDGFTSKSIVGMCQISNKINNIKILQNSFLLMKIMSIFGKSQILKNLLQNKNFRMKK